MGSYGLGQLVCIHVPGVEQIQSALLAEHLLCTGYSFKAFYMDFPIS